MSKTSNGGSPNMQLSRGIPMKYAGLTEQATLCRQQAKDCTGFILIAGVKYV
ncbi:hypothetical protein ABIE12_002680 [Serratia sp. 509]